MTTCRECEFVVAHPVGRLTVSRVGLFSDARFPGRSILSLRDHYDDIADAPTEITELFQIDIQFASDIICRATGADRVDVALSVAGESHVHAHLVPRRRDRDPRPEQGPDEDPRPHQPLEPLREALAIGLLAAAFEAAGAGLAGA
ncbi:hypothetical protein AB0N61_04980 [Microbacterium sp. NPDC089320]|uniref:hypothetical protein n=1 Tax=Microbacterium sp. NPDC089320 TaxID=3155182 RepID=UPI00344ACFA4